VLPISAAIAVLKYRLYDIELVINKTLVYGALAGFVTVVYAAIVVGAGAAFGTGSHPNLGLSIAATAVVAMAFGPARERAQALANLVVYGHRASPYEVLTDFSHRMGEVPGTREVLARMAELLGEAIGAARTEVWLRVGDRLRASASWPDDVCVTESVPLQGGELRLPTPADLTLPVRHHGELLGALTVKTKPGEAISPVAVMLASDLASQAGHVLRNLRLTEELMARLEDLRASRERLVSAQDEERRRLERDLHDGAQQYLVALKVHLSLAAHGLDQEPSQVRGMLDELAGLADEALASLRELAHGIYPPLLADRGLAAAVRAHTDRSPLPVEVVTDGLGRYPRETEAAVYFCCLEALQNVAKYSQASRVTVRLTHTRGDLCFCVDDDGRGFDSAVTQRGAGLQNMTDRLEILSGCLEVISSPGQGTKVSGRVPLGRSGTSPEPAGVG